MAKRKKIPQGVFSTSIHNLTHEGRGVGEVDGMKVFIAGALPSEEVEFEYKYLRRRLAQGTVVQVKKASSMRVEPKCKHFDVCGGCAIQHMEPNAAFDFKQSVVLEQLEHFAKIKPQQILAPLQSQSFGYRTKARLGVRYVEKKGGVLVGFREKFSNRIAVMDSCEVLHPSVGNLIEPLKTLIAQLSIPEQIPQIEIAVGEDATALILRHLEPLTDRDLVHASAFAKEFNLWLYTQASGIDSVTKVYPDDKQDFLHYHLDSHQIKMAFHPTDFTQVNMQINQQMITAAIEQLALREDDKVIDLFCGIGNFTLPLARHCTQIVGVEGSLTAIERAKMNAEYNKIAAVDFYVENLFNTAYTQPWQHQDFNKVLLDPPRSGAQEVLPWIASKQPEKILYVSCNPATLARDSGLLVHEHGYQLKTLRVMDMFPHTSHVESMALFERG